MQKVDLKLNGADSVQEQIRRLEKELKDKREETARRKREAKRLKKLGLEADSENSQEEQELEETINQDDAGKNTPAPPEVKDRDP